MMEHLGLHVNFVNRAGDIRPAFVVHIWTPTMVNLQVLTDGENDGAENVVWETSVPYDASESPFSWHFRGQVKPLS